MYFKHLVHIVQEWTRYRSPEGSPEGSLEGSPEGGTRQHNNANIIPPRLEYPKALVLFHFISFNYIPDPIHFSQFQTSNESLVYPIGVTYNTREAF